MRAKDLIIKESDLFEIDMSPSSLQRLVQGIDARAGMEFEMIVPDAQGDDDEGDLEPDYDMDESVYSIDDAINFFRDGDYNGRREIANLREEMTNQYYEWLDEQKLEQWGEEAMEYVKDWLWRTYEDEWREEAREAVLGNAPEFGANDDELRAKIEQMVRLRHDEVTEDVLANMGYDYDQAYDEWSDDFNANADMEEEWLRSQGIRRMTDVESNFDITWPHYTSSRNEDGQDVYEIAREFGAAVGMGVNASERYHGGRREPNKYVVEPDGSLEADNPGDAGLEFVSPPMTISQMIEQLQLVKAWASQRGCYTNESTGLHMNISVPGWSGNINDLDYVKLALLLGDEYILDQFGRTGNTYAKSALDIVKRQAAQRPDDVKVLMDKMREHLNTAAAKMIHSGVTSKYTSINVKDGYIEFRSPGGDWLGENFNLITNTLLRFVVAMDAAVDPSKYRTEYLKKLYAILQPKDANDPIAYFAQYASGQLPKQALKSFIRQAQLQRKVDKDPTGGQKYWWKVARPGYFASVEVVAASKEEAIEKGKREYPDWANARDMTAKPLRPYQEPEPRPQAQQSTGPSLNGRPSNPDGNYVILNMADETVPVYRFMASNDEDALLVQQQWSRDNPGPSWRYKADPNQRLGQPRPAQTQTGNWGIWIRSANRFARAPGQTDNSVLRRFPGRDTALQWVERTRAENPQMRTDIEVREIEPAQGDNWSQDFERRMSADTSQSGVAGGQTDMENRLGWGSQSADANYEIVDRRTNRPVFLFIANTETEAWRKYSDWLAAAGYPEDTEDFGWRRRGDRGQPARSGSEQNQQGEFTGQWRVLDSTGREVYRFGGVGNSQADANRIALGWIQQQGRTNQEHDVVPVMR